MGGCGGSRITVSALRESRTLKHQNSTRPSSPLQLPPARLESFRFRAQFRRLPCAVFSPSLLYRTPNGSCSDDPVKRPKLLGWTIRLPQACSARRRAWRLLAKEAYRSYHKIVYCHRKAPSTPINDTILLSRRRHDMTSYFRGSATRKPAFSVCSTRARMSQRKRSDLPSQLPCQTRNGSAFDSNNGAQA